MAALAVEEGFLHSPARRAIRLGVDITYVPAAESTIQARIHPYFFGSHWFFLAQKATRGKNPKLKAIFDRLWRLLEKMVIPIFVFDGKDRPNVKRGQKVAEHESWLDEATKELIEAFGFQWVEVSLPQFYLSLLSR
jgi:hypothetical protein